MSSLYGVLVSCHITVWCLYIMLYHCRGVLPFSERKQVISQVQEKSRFVVPFSLGSRKEQVQEGSRVTLRSRPIYSTGCEVIYIKGSVVKCGVLMESVFSLTEKCRFKIIPEGSSRHGNESMESEGDGNEPQIGNSFRSHTTLHVHCVVCHYTCT